MDSSKFDRTWKKIEIFFFKESSARVVSETKLAYLRLIFMRLDNIKSDFNSTSHLYWNIILKPFFRTRFKYLQLRDDRISINPSKRLNLFCSILIPFYHCVQCFVLVDILENECESRTNKVKQ